MNIVLDTNILVSALLSQGTAPDQLYQHWLGGTYRLLTSLQQREELNRVFSYPKIAKRITSEQAKELLGNLDADALFLSKLPEIDLSPDPDDNAILATAIAGKANLLVTGDKRHLLSLGEVEGIPIVTAREALKRIEDSIAG